MNIPDEIWMHVENGALSCHTRPIDHHSVAFVPLLRAVKADTRIRELEGALRKIANDPDDMPNEPDRDDYQNLVDIATAALAQSDTVGVVPADPRHERGCIFRYGAVPEGGSEYIDHPERCPCHGRPDAADG